MTTPDGAPQGLVYVRPSFGGLYDYSEAILRVLRSEHPGARIEVLTVRAGSSPWSEGLRLAREIGARPGLVVADIGCNDRSIFWALHHLRADRDLVITVHDPGVFVSQLFRIPGVASRSFPVHALAFQCGKALDTLVGRPLFKRVLRRARVRLVLNASVRDLWGAPLSYLPQPVYDPRIVPHAMPVPPCIAFAGYWGPAKGLDELLDAFGHLLPRFPGVRFVIAGSATSPDDPWAARFRARARAVSERVEMPGFIAADEFDTFLRSLTALVLPYRTEVPGAASAMLMRAQQAGVPLIVSDTPFLRAQVDAESVAVVPPRDVPALTAAIEAHLSNPEALNARAAREQARIYATHGDAAVGSSLRRVLGLSHRLARPEDEASQARRA